MDTFVGVIILVSALTYGLFDVTKKETGCSDLAAPEEEEE